MPTKGGIYFSGKDITKLSEGARNELRRLDMAYVFQSVALISTMTSYENIEFGLSIAGYPRNKRKQRAEECLCMVGLQKRMKHYPGEMSGGEQQRVAIARAIAHKPKIIFADEPTAEVDTIMGLQIVNIFKTLVHEEKLTVIMTTHDPGMMELADMVYTLEDGAVIDAG
jgi:putative ABC transport system ATP-binding protein